jgi:hypothetical protein
MLHVSSSGNPNGVRCNAIISAAAAADDFPFSFVVGSSAAFAPVFSGFDSFGSSLGRFGRGFRSRKWRGDDKSRLHPSHHPAEAPRRASAA